MKKLTEIVVCFGAAVVIIGAWAKLLHRPYADTMLTVGLLTEAAIFCLYGFMAIGEKENTQSENKVNTDPSVKELLQTLKNIFKNA